MTKCPHEITAWTKEATLAAIAGVALTFLVKINPSAQRANKMRRQNGPIESRSSSQLQILYITSCRIVESHGAICRTLQKLLHRRRRTCNQFRWFAFANHRALKNNNNVIRNFFGFQYVMRNDD